MASRLTKGRGEAAAGVQECLPCFKKIQDGTFNTTTARGRGIILKSRLSTNAVTNEMKLMNIAITHMRQAMPQPNSNRCQATGGDQQGLYGRLIRKTAGRIRQTQIRHTLESCLSIPVQWLPNHQDQSKCLRHPKLRWRDVTCY